MTESQIETTADGRLICPDCGRTFDKPQKLGAHRARAHGFRKGDDVVLVKQGGVETETTLATDSTGNGPIEPDAQVFEEVPNRFVNLNVYPLALQEFLPELEAEIRIRRSIEVGGREMAEDLITAFFLLFRDQANV